MTQAEEPTLDLLQRWQRGDRTALEQLLADVMPWLRKEMRRALAGTPRGEQDSMDLAQAAVTSFLSHGPRFVPQSPAQFRSLLKRIATNELIDQKRRDRRGGGARHLDSLVHSGHPLSGLAAPGGSADDPRRQVEGSEDRQWVRLALQFVSDEDRWLLLASEVEGLSWAAIAEELGVASPDTVRMRCARIKPRLANVLRRLRSGQMPADA
jgi:RNA polymerase sigma factor (sigma-70 family)